MKVLMIFVVTVVIIIFLFWFKNPAPQTLGESIKSKISPIAEVILKTLKDAQGTYAVVFKNLKTGDVYHLNDQKKFAAGSLYKLWILGETYAQIEGGLIARDETLNDSLDSLNQRYGSSESSGGMVTFALQDAIKEMITVSNNYAAFLLTYRITIASTSSFLTEYGFKDSLVGNEGLPTTTALDMANFFEKIYRGKIINPTASSEILEILKKQTLNQKIPKYLPPETKIAHKTGEVENFSHDAGIVFTDKGDYILVVMSETDLPGFANEEIAKLSKAVYDYVTH